MEQHSAANEAHDHLPVMRIGQGFDVHAFAPERRLVLGGVHIPEGPGLAGHSDADVLVHAIMDALLGAAALGDIGELFPDHDARFCGADSCELLAEVMRQLHREGWRIGNIDACVIAQRPRISPYKQVMRQRLAEVMGINCGQLNIKATTTEKLGFTGRGEGIAAQATALLNRS